MAKSKSEFDASAVWDRLCDFVSEDDGLPIYPCGGWTIDKLHFLCRYLTVTTNAMKSHPKFTAINYIDLFCGNGVCQSPRSGRNAKRYPGSALLAAACPKHFDNLYLVDTDPDNVQAIEQRISRLGCLSRIQTFAIDANQAVPLISDNLPDRSLSVAFIDPFKFEGITFDSLRSLTDGRLIDLIILFADAMDAVRNLDRYLSQYDSAIDRVFGKKSNWKEESSNVVNRNAENVRQFLRNAYIDQIRKLGYTEFETRTISTDGKPLYCLVFASKNPLGLKFSHIALEEDRAGERNLWTI